MADLWVMFGVAALLLRAGFALYLAGISRSKNTMSSLFRATVEIAIGVLAFAAMGGAILDGSWHEIANPGGATTLFLAATFLIGPAVIAGATLERCRTSVVIASAILMPGILTPLAWKLLQWNWLVTRGFVDDAGATFIHFAAGLAAIVAAIAVGPRTGKYNHDGSTNVIMGHNLPLASGGVLLMFAMWIPYVVGFSPTSVSTAFNVILAGSAGVVAALLYCKVRYARSDIFLVYAGLMGGLVSITAGADRISPPLAILIGAVAGIVVPYVIVTLDLVWKIDDPAGGITIHGLGGLWSAVAIAVLAPGTFAERIGRLGAEGVGLAVVAALTLGAAALVFFALGSLVRIRSRESEEFEGLDLAEHDLNAYPDFQQTTIKSYHLREM